MAAFSLYELLPQAAAIEIVDVGAFDLVSHPPIYTPLVRAGHARLMGFEPYPQACSQLTLKYGPPHRFLPLFVGAGGPAKFYATNRGWTGSLFPPNTALLEAVHGLAEETQLVGVHDVTTVRLDDVSEIDDVDFIKIDVQGSELDVLKGAERVLGRAVAVHTEVEFVELYRGVPLVAEIDLHLRSRGFWIHTFRDFGSGSVKPLPAMPPAGEDEGPHQRLWADAVYIRSPLELDALADDKLCRLAILLHDLYGSHDLAYRCLSAHDERVGGAVAAAYRARLARP
ncbi:MAG: FkbM family methyltransferase [Alphaproteobacteria bacterium]|nr:FkbM family methyltransferase [Alphaproteobacteria bacterium]